MCIRFDLCMDAWRDACVYAFRALTDSHTHSLTHTRTGALTLANKVSQGSGSGGEKCTSQSPNLMKVDCCSASSQYSHNHGCPNAFDGTHRNEWATKGEGAGSWIIAYLVGTVSKFTYKQRTSRADWNKDIRLEFSDGSTQTYQLQATADVQTFTLSKPVKTTYVKIVVVSTHNKLNNGAAEIQFFGCSSGTAACGGSQGSGGGGEECTLCTTVSEVCVHGYACLHVYTRAAMPAFPLETYLCS